MGIFTGKVAIITGGGKAKSIGYGVATAYAKEGANLAITGRNEQKLLDAKEELERLYGIKVLPIVADVNADEESEQVVKDAVKKVYDTFGRIDVLINNAGMGCPDGFLTLQDDLWVREIDVNLTVVSEACRLVLPYFRKAGSGCILSTSSLCGRIAATVRSIYAVTKAGVNAYTKALALELAPWHVRVNAVAPGMVGTDMVKANHPDPEDYRSLGGSAMLQRMGELEEIAAAMVFLASNLSRFCVPVLSRWLALGPLLCYTICQIHGKGGGVLQIEIKQEQQLSAQQLQSLQVLQMGRLGLCAPAGAGGRGGPRPPPVGRGAVRLHEGQGL